MGWNSSSYPPIRYSISWRDSVRDARMDTFARELQAEVELYIAEAIRNEFKDEIEKDQVCFMVGEHDSY